MKKSLILLAFATSLGLGTAFAQFGPQPGTGAFSDAQAKLFGDNTAFSATVEMRVKTSRNEMNIPGKLAFDSGKARFEINMADMSNLNPQQIQQMKSMGMDQLITIARPDQQNAYMIYPGLQSYAVVALKDQNSAATNDFKMDVTELGNETVDGRSCVKNKVVVTDSKGVAHESTVWNATDLKKFPVKIVTSQNGNDTTMLFSNVKLAKPDAAQFEPPAAYTKYDNVQTLMQEQMMKKMGGGMGMPH